MSEIPPRELSSAMFADFTRDERFKNRSYGSDQVSTQGLIRGSPGAN